jgi:Rieske Fe-S protein
VTTRPVGTPITRRRALAGATSVGLALPVLSACGDDGGTATDAAGSGSPSGSSSPTPSSAAPSSTPTSSAAAPETSAPAVEGLVSTADVPVGSGVIFADEQVVVTQPTEGDIKVFSSICTHTGCPVAQVTDVITCPCHGSTFDITSGDPIQGPATTPLAVAGFSVDGDQVVLT